MGSEAVLARHPFAPHRISLDAPGGVLFWPCRPSILMLFGYGPGAAQLNQLLQCQRGVVDALHTNTEVPRIGLISSHDEIAVGMSVNISGAPVVRHGVRMNWDVGQDEIAQLVTTTYVVEVGSVISQFEDVVVAPNQDFLAIQPGHDRQGFPCDGNITQVIYLVARFDDSVPSVHHRLVHLGGVIPRAYLGTIPIQEMADALLSEMRVADEENVGHAYLKVKGSLV